MAHSLPGGEVVAMKTAEDCRSAAFLRLRAAEAATDPKTSACFRRTAESWSALALQIEQDPHTVRQRNAVLQKSHQTEPHEATAHTAQAADILRQRLQLSDSDEPRS